MNKNSILELIRFVAALIIMQHHAFVVCKTPDLYPAYNGWIFVEFFLILTGFLTARHFGNNDQDEQKWEIATKYTISKFSVILPYIMTFTIGIWVLEGVNLAVENNWSVDVFAAYFTGDFISDILLISGSYGAPKLAPLWYVYAMVLVFPFFSVFCQIKDKYKIMLISIAFSLVFYGVKGIEGYSSMPYSLLRVLSGMMLGLFGYEAINIYYKRISNINKGILSIIELAMGITPIAVCYFNFVFYGYTTYRTMLLCFVVYVTLSLSGLTYTSRIKSNFLNYLGKISSLIYIDHYFVARFLKIFNFEAKFGGGVLCFCIT